MTSLDPEEFLKPDEKDNEDIRNFNFEDEDEDDDDDDDDDGENDPWHDSWIEIESAKCDYCGLMKCGKISHKILDDRYEDCSCICGKCLNAAKKSGNLLKFQNRGRNIWYKRLWLYKWGNPFGKYGDHEIFTDRQADELVKSFSGIHSEESIPDEKKRELDKIIDAYLIRAADAGEVMRKKVEHAIIVFEYYEFDMWQLENSTEKHVVVWNQLNKGPLKDTYDVLLKSKHENDDVDTKPSKKQDYIDLLGPELEFRYNEFKLNGTLPREFDEISI